MIRLFMAMPALVLSDVLQVASNTARSVGKRIAKRPPGGPL